VSVEKYWPGPLTWEDIVAAVRDLPEYITDEDIGTVAFLAGLLGVFGFPEGSEYQVKREERDDERYN
jgi:hypothetical protein